MRDEEVGELWANYHDCGPHVPGAATICQLICQLVQERFTRYMEGWQERGGPTPTMNEVLSDFGIDPATWPKE